MLTESKIEELKVEFVEYLEEEQGIVCTEDDIVRTADTVQGFIDACREYQSIDTDTFNGRTVTIIKGSQRHKGERRKDLYIFDVEEHVRLVLA
uniref:Uncharacterized protein n=1 Tax=viral metagenome TaxID=1070528 RepID=A0A6M3KMS2_9ZZZZ